MRRQNDATSQCCVCRCLVVNLSESGFSLPSSCQLELGHLPLCDFAQNRQILTIERGRKPWQKFLGITVVEAPAETARSLPDRPTKPKRQLSKNNTRQNSKENDSKDYCQKQAALAGVQVASNHKWKSKLQKSQNPRPANCAVR